MPTLRNSIGPVAIMAILIGIVLGLILIVSSAGSASVPNPGTYPGVWKSMDKKFDLEATITNTDIEIYWTEGDTRALYWKGSFTSNPAKDNTTIQSKGDVQAMSGSVLASMDDEKFFTYQNGQLKFELSILGTGKTVHLEKQ